MLYVRNAWYAAAWDHEVVSERPRSVRIINEPIVVWRTTEGELAAFEDRCVHRLAPLSLGRCEGNKLRCMYHGLVYDRCGKVIEIPGQDKIPDTARVRTYPAISRHGWVWIWMGDPSAADEGLMPPILGLGHPGYHFACNWLDYAANARLINDNLLDLSHVSFLHGSTFGVSETWARERPKVTTSGRSVRIERWIRNEGNIGQKNAEAMMDSYIFYEYFVPGVVMITSCTYPPGTADALKGTPPDLDAATTRVFTSQAVTPVTHRRAHYFYLMATREDMAPPNMDLVRKAFEEDRSMIEAQQKVMDEVPDRREMPTTADRAIVLFNRLLDRTAREEATQAKAS